MLLLSLLSKAMCAWTASKPETVQLVGLATDQLAREAGQVILLIIIMYI